MVSVLGFLVGPERRGSSVAPFDCLEEEHENGKDNVNRHWHQVAIIEANE